jgi:hypothetical protein
MNIDKIRFLNNNVLKILAAIFMVIDHAGILFFPKYEIFRIIGRLAYPIFAYMIAEGARYTRNKVKYLATIAALATICQLVYYFAMNDLYMCILVTFSLSIITIYAIGYFKQCLFAEKPDPLKCIFSALLLILTVLAVYQLNQVLEIDYDFIGCMIPAMISIFDFRNIKLPEKFKWLDSYYLKIAALAIGLILLALTKGERQYYALLSIPLLLLYSGERGTTKLKYFFYIFYPLHLVVLQGIAILLRIIK